MFISKPKKYFLHAFLGISYSELLVIFQFLVIRSIFIPELTLSSTSQQCLWILPSYLFLTSTDLKFYLSLSIVAKSVGSAPVFFH